MSTAPRPELGRTTDLALHDTRVYYRILGLVGVGFFVQTIATDSGGIAGLPLKLLLKDHLHLAATAVAGFSTLANVAWYLKPIAGAVADNVKLGGTRYRNFLLLSAIGAAISWAAMGIVPHEYAALLLTFIVVNVFLMIFSTVLGGYMVTESRVFNATGRLGSFRNNAMTLAGLIAGPAAGFLASKVFGLTAFANALMLFGLFVFIFFALREKPVPRDPTAPSPLQKLREEIRPLLQAKTFWAAVGMTFFITVMPGFGTLLTYYQTNDLHFSDQFIGNLGLVGGITGLIGGFGYILLCRIFRLRTMLAISIVTSAAATALFEYYRSPGTAIIITAISGLLGALASIATFDLAARASPVRSASMCYSLLMAVYNLGSQLGDVGGSWIHDRFHVSFFNLIWISAGTTLLTLIAVPLLPSSLVDSTDGEPDLADPTPVPDL